MAPHFSEELLEMILEAALTIPEGVLKNPHPSPSHDLSTFNVRICSSSELLLVCKQWLRIETAYLYHTIIIRSRLQACYLTRTLDNFPELAEFMKALHIEGLYSHLRQLLRRCLNLHTLVCNLDHTFQNNAHTFHQGLSWINPAAVIVCERGGKNYRPEPGSALWALSMSIRAWSNLVCSRIISHCQAHLMVFTSNR
jgi:hypothetical protein